VKRTRGPAAARGRKRTAGASRRVKASRAGLVPKPGPSGVSRWNADPEDVQRSVVQLVLSLVEFLRELMERQAVRRMEEQTLTDAESESVGLALMKLERTILELADRFNIDPADLNLDLGPLGKLR
jgi:Gas vesicle protein K